MALEGFRDKTTKSSLRSLMLHQWWSPPWSTMLNSQLCEGVDPILSPAKLLTLEMEKLFGNCFGRLLCVLSVKNGRRTILNVYLTSPTCFTLMWAPLWAARRLSRTLQLSHLRVLILEVKLQWCQRTGINSPPPHATFQVFLRPGSIEIIAEQ